MHKPHSHHIAASLMLAAAVFLGSTAWYGAHVPTALAACPAGTSVTLTVGPSGNPSTTSFSGIQTLHAQTTTGTPPSGMTFVIIAPMNLALGQGVQNGSDWIMDWDSRNVPNGTYQFEAIAHYGTATTYDCPSVAVPGSVLNAPTQNPTLTASIGPSGWAGLPGQSVSFTAGAIYVDQFGRQSPLPDTAIIQCSTTAGPISAPASPTTILTAGPATGSFTLNLKVAANGLEAHASVPIKVFTSTAGNTSTSGGSGPSPSPSTNPSPSPGPQSTSSANDATGTLTPAEVQRFTTQPTIFRPAEATNSKPLVAIRVLSCLEQALGEDRYTAVSTGKTTPTTKERRQAAGCFSGSEKIPAVLAPVEPTRIAEVATATDVIKMDGLRNETIKNTMGETTTAILMSGTSTPNSSVFIYIFSDPMVLRAQTDGQGKWTYVLQNPLKPGHHEFYAVAAKDSDTFVRTPALPVTIAAAAPGGSTDGNLVIEQRWTAAQVAFAGGAGLLILAALFLLVRLRHRQRQSTAPNTAPELSQPPADEVTS